MVSKKKIEVTYADTDMMGVVYHGSYIVWFELARTKFFNDVGFTMQECSERNIMFPIVNLNVQYLSPTKYLDEVEIVTTVKEFSKLSTTYLHKVYASGVLSVVAEVQLVCVDTETFRPTNIKKRFVEVYDKYCEVMANGKN